MIDTMYTTHDQPFPAAHLTDEQLPAAIIALGDDLDSIVRAWRAEEPHTIRDGQLWKAYRRMLREAAQVVIEARRRGVELPILSPTMLIDAIVLETERNVRSASYFIASGS